LPYGDGRHPTDQHTFQEDHMSKVWFITGAGRGFGREFTKAALERGDRVAATARDTSALDDLVAAHGDALLPLRLDVTDRAAVFAAVAEATKALGRLDVVVNNAGYGLFGAVEEISEQQLRDQLETNLFGVFHVTQAVLPVLREQGSGHIVQISTIGGQAAFPQLGGYHASKWALEGLTESLAQEVAAFGIKVTLVEPGAYGTDWAGSSAVHAEPQPQYDPLREAMAARRGQSRPGFTGDPAAAGPALLKIVDAEEPPLRVLFGTVPTQMLPQIVQKRLDTWEQWKHVSIEANGTA
jgi:NAD(P)-dependent dehydrogenase (short-subunit alcohol dehydrogenase family)